MSHLMVLTEGAQTGTEECFIGGKPKLPPDSSVPQCVLCGADQTFLFQVAFPGEHVWTGLSLAVFLCTNCADENHLIPEMLPGVLAGADIPVNFLTNYQRNFHFLVFPTESGQFDTRYPERVKFSPIRLQRTGSGLGMGLIGGTPAWVMEDESPRTYGSRVPMHFLLQIHAGLEFRMVQGAPPQMEVGLAGEPEPSPHDFYQLFIGNVVYFFGTETRTPPLVYAITQVS